MKIFGVFALFLVASCANAGESPRACAPPDYFELNGIRPGDNSAALQKLGPPRAIDSYEGEDDGGQYTGKRLTFLHFQVDIEQLRGVERIATADSTVPLPAGIRIGMPLSEVEERMHFISGNLGESNEVVLPACGVGEGAELRLRFNSESSGALLSKVEIVQYGP